MTTPKKTENAKSQNVTRIKHFIPSSYLSKPEREALVKEGVRLIKEDIELLISASTKNKKRK
jgi:hypothetical protein